MSHIVIKCGQVQLKYKKTKACSTDYLKQR